MKSALGIIVAILFLIIVGGLYYYSSYNQAISIRDQAQEEWKHLKSQLESKANLVIKLSNFVQKQTNDNQTDVFGFIKSAARNLKSAATVQESAKSFFTLEKNLSRIFSLTEKYPQLKVNDNFTTLSGKVESLDNKISVSIKKYNSLVKLYNRRLDSFPMSIVKRGAKLERLNEFKASYNK